MTEPLYVLPVQQPDAHALAVGRTRQVSRSFPPSDPSLIGRWVAIQATDHDPCRVKSMAPTWAVVAVGKLTGAGYHPGFERFPEAHHGRSYKRERGKAGPWVWTFSNVVRLAPIVLARLEVQRWRGDAAPSHREDDGGGSWWSCCLRPLDVAMVERVREARRKAKST